MFAALTEALLLLLGILFGFLIAVLRDRLARLLQFRAKINVFGARLGETGDEEISAFYDSTRLEVLEVGAAIRQDILLWKRGRFDRAFAAYCESQKKDHARQVNVFIHSLCPSAWPMQPDQRPLRDRLTDALKGLADCAK